MSGIVAAVKYGALVCLSAILASSSALGQSNPVPLVNQPLVPMTLPPGGSSFTLTVNGTGFVSGSVVNWNGAPLATTFVSGSQLTAAVPAADIASAETAWVTVVSPTPGGGKSNVQYFDTSNTASSLTFTQLVPFAPEVFEVGNFTSNPILADFNGDGELDIAYPSYSGALVVQLGNGDGSFQPPLTSEATNGSASLAVGDFNGDGKLDLAIANGNSTVSVLLGNGDGTFQPPLTFTTGTANPTQIVVGDFNGDGKLDLATGTYEPSGPISILLGNGDGTFQPHGDYATTSAGAAGLVVGDFNGDGYLDLVYVGVDEFTDQQLSFLQGNGDGTFQPPVTYPAVGSNLTALVAADINGDGKLDLIASDDTESPLTGDGGAWVWLGNGDGTFQSQTEYATGSQSEYLAVQDFNADDKLDVILPNAVPYDFFALLGNANGTLQTPISFPLGALPVTALAGDFNGDGKMDLAFATQPNSGGAIVVFLQGDWPVANPSPTSLTFAQQAVGTTSSPQVVTVTNTGSATLTVAGIGISGADAGDFGETNNCPASLAANGNCQVSLTFTPASLLLNTSATALLNIADNAAGSPQTVSLTGTTPPPNPAPIASLSPASLTFPSQYVGTSGLPQTVTLTNSGTATLTIASVATVPAGFGALSDCGNSVAAGSSCAIGVFFDPTGGGSMAGTLLVSDNASGSPQIVALTGMGQDFSLAPSGSSTATVTAGGSASYTLLLGPLGGFTQAVALSCSGAPAMSRCSVSPNSVVLNNSTLKTVAVTVTTTGSSAHLDHSSADPPKGRWVALWLTVPALFGLVLLGSCSRKGRNTGIYGLALLCAVSLGGMSLSCGGSSSSTSAGTPAGSYNLTVTATFTSGSATLTHATKLTLVVQQ
jgi:hypothetical protein